MVNGASEVATHDSSCFSERIVGVKAVDWVESYGVDFDEDFSWAGTWDVHRADECGLLLGVE